uniref:Uncharacterized protein n=1 Tax=Meloidogyne incognita TaxID=6306 RepID=A0A914NLZ4_MELIC
MPSTKNQKLFARLPTVQFVQKEEGLRSGKNLTKLNLSGTGTLPRGFSLDTAVKRSGSELKFPEPFEKNEEKNGQEKEEDKLKKPLKEEKEDDSNQNSKLPLHHLKMRLKKTTSETSAVQSTSNNQQTDEPNSSRLVRPEPKPRRSVDPSVESCLKSNQKTKFESSNATTSGSSLQNIDEEKEKKDNELHAKIKQLRHVQRITAEEEDNTPEGIEGNLDEQNEEPEESNLGAKMTKMKIENESQKINEIPKQQQIQQQSNKKINTEPPPKMRHLVTQKVAPLQHHRPFSMQAISEGVQETKKEEDNSSNIEGVYLTSSVTFNRPQKPEISDILNATDEKTAELTIEKNKVEVLKTSLNDKKDEKDYSVASPVKFRPFSTLQRPEKPNDDKISQACTKPKCITVAQPKLPSPERDIQQIPAIRRSDPSMPSKDNINQLTPQSERHSASSTIQRHSNIFLGDNENSPRLPREPSPSLLSSKEHHQVPLPEDSGQQQQTPPVSKDYLNELHRQLN